MQWSRIHPSTMSGQWKSCIAHHILNIRREKLEKWAFGEVGLGEVSFRKSEILSDFRRSEHSEKWALGELSFRRSEHSEIWAVGEVGTRLGKVNTRRSDLRRNEIRRSEHFGEVNIRRNGHSEMCTFGETSFGDLGWHRLLILPTLRVYSNLTSRWHESVNP